MRKLVITQNVTLDGSVEMLDDWFDPQLQDDDLLAESHRQDSEADALLLGRQTFEDFRSYWPQQTADTTGITAYLNQVAKYVVSSTVKDPEWQNSTVIATGPVEQIDALKRQPGSDIVLTWSISLAQHRHHRRARRRVPTFRLPRDPGSRPATLSRRLRDPAAAIGGARRVVWVGHQPAALRATLTGFATGATGECPAHVDSTNRASHARRHLHQPRGGGLA